MKQDYYSIVEMGFTGAAVLGFAFWQLWSISRELKRDRAEAERRASAKRAGHAVGEHRLDDR